MDFFIQLTINGIMLGALYAIMALGFSVVWGVMRLINLAHGEFIMVGAYIAWILSHPARQDFALKVGDIKTPINTLALVGILLWASLGFILSKFALEKLPNRIVRYIAGYILSVIAVFALYTLWTSAGSPPIDPFMTIPIVMIIVFGIGYFLQRWLFNRVVEGPHLTMLLITFSVSLILSNIVLLIFTANPLTINLTYERGINITDRITLSPVRVIVCFLSLIVGGMLTAFMRYTSLGRAIRASAQHKMAAKLVGIDVKEVYALAFALSVAVAGASGAMMSSFTTIVPSLGTPLTLRAFAVTALGGLGKVEGVLVGGMVLGLVESYVGGYINTGWQLAAAFILLVVFLIVRPQGLLGGLKATVES